jgi:hypothetical protein
MAYALIPEGFKLEKVTRAQADAVSAKRRHDDIVALLNNTNTPLVIGGLVTAFFGARLAGDIISDLEEKVGGLSEDVKEGIVETVAKAEKELITDPQSWVATQLTGLISLGAKIKRRAEEVDIKPGALA